MNYPFVKQTSQGFRMACPNGHVDLVPSDLPDSPLTFTQLFCPHCHNPDGSNWPVCSCTRSALEKFANRDSGGDPALAARMLEDMCAYYGL